MYCQSCLRIHTLVLVLARKKNQHHLQQHATSLLEGNANFSVLLSTSVLLCAIFMRVHSNENKKELGDSQEEGEAAIVTGSGKRKKNDVIVAAKLKQKLPAVKNCGNNDNAEVGLKKKQKSVMKPPVPMKQ